MSSFATDRNLLVGVLGLQMDLISQSQLIAALQAWTLQKTAKIEDILLQQNAIRKEQHEFLVGMAERHVALHKSDPATSLASLKSFGPVKKELQAIDDKDVDQSITRISELRAELSLESGSGNDQTVVMSTPSLSGSSRFQILRPHAMGGLGQVSVAEDRELHREVALKEILSEHAADPASRARFQIEAEVTGQLEHPGVVPVYSLGTTSSGCPFYVMRFIKGDSLKEAITRLHGPDNRRPAEENRMTLRRLVRRLVDVCNAIEYAHSRGVLHRDLKPGNIMLGKYGETLVVDWGLAKTGTRSGSQQYPDERTFVPLSGDASSETRMGSIVGTVAYMSPEQADGKLDSLGPASDVYSLGATLYCILTGQAPIPKLPTEEMVQLVRTGQIRPPRELNSLIPHALQAICLKAMSCRPADRYPSSAAFAEELELWLADEPVRAYREPLIDRTVRLVRRHRTSFAAFVGVLTTMVIALIIVNSLVHRQNNDLAIARDVAEVSWQKAVEEQTRADASRDEAILQERRAEQNLATARKLALDMLRTAEEKLSKSPFDTNTGIPLRKSLTEKAFADFQDIYQQNPLDQEVTFEFAQVARISANLLRLERDLPAADERIHKALQLQLSLPADKQTMAQKDYLAETYRDIGTLRKAQGRLTDADKALGTALNIVQGLIAAVPDSPLYKRSKATIELEQVSLNSDRMELEVALQKAVGSLAVFRNLATSDHAAETDASLLLLASAREVKLLHDLGRHDEAVAASVIAIAEAVTWRTKRPDDANILLPLARLYYWSAEGRINAAGAPDDTTASLAEARAILEGLVRKQGRAGYIYGLGDTLRIQGRLLRLQMKYAESEVVLLESKSWLEKLLAASDTADHRDVLAKTLLELALTKKAAGEKPAALEYFQQAVTLQTQASQSAPENAEMANLRQFMASQLEEAKQQP